MFGFSFLLERPLRKSVLKGHENHRGGDLGPVAFSLGGASSAMGIDRWEEEYEEGEVVYFFILRNS